MDAKNTKICTKCEVEKDLSEFGKCKKSKDGHMARCKICRREDCKIYHELNREKKALRSKKYRLENKDKLSKKGKEYYKNNKEKISEYGKKYRSNHKEKDAERGRKYRAENKEKLTEWHRQHYTKNKDRILATQKKNYEEDKEKFAKRIRNQYMKNIERYKEYHKNYYEDNKEKITKAAKIYRQVRKDFLIIAKRKWRKNNPELDRLYSQRRLARKANLPDTLTADEWFKTLEFFDHSCSKCGSDDITMDHWIPISFKGDNPGTQIFNVIPLCQSCNSSKHSKMPEIYYKDEPEFYNMITEYLESRRPLDVV